MTEKEATIQEGTNRFMDSLPERRAQEEYEPYWHYSESQYRHSEFNKKIHVKLYVAKMGN